MSGRTNCASRDDAFVAINAAKLARDDEPGFALLGDVAGQKKK